MPTVEQPDGRLMTDTTPMIAAFEEQRRESPVVPRDPVLAFLAQRLEDYFEAWLWRPDIRCRLRAVCLHAPTAAAPVGAECPLSTAFVFASRPDAMGRVMAIVHRAIATHLTRKAGFTHSTACTRAVTPV
ncbi:MAG: hypothetical protein ACI87W_002601 [Halieaceae bacterium]|jgi:hypothetical protein